MLPMNEKRCIVCQDFPVFHKIQIIADGQEKIQYLCTEHFGQIQDPKRFFSLLTSHEMQIPPEEILYTEIFSD